MASKRITADRLDEEIRKILDKYGEEVEGNLDFVTKKVAQKGATALRNDSRETFGGTGEYASGWTATSVKYPHYTSAVIHNKNEPGLPHLLEHGHAMRNGGRVQGRIHIEPVETNLIAEYEREVLKKL